MSVCPKCLLEEKKFDRKDSFLQSAAAIMEAIGNDCNPEVIKSMAANWLWNWDQLK